MEREQEENQKQLKELPLSLRRSNNRLISRILVGEVKKIAGEIPKVTE